MAEDICWREGASCLVETQAFHLFELLPASGMEHHK